MRIARIAAVAASVAVVLVPGAAALDIEVDVQPHAGEVGTPYEFEFEGEEGCVPYFFSYLNGTLPPGLRITQDGKLVGTPTEAGSFTFWVALEDNSGPDNPFCPDPSVQSQGEFTMVVMPDLHISTTSIPPAVAGRPYSAKLTPANTELGWPLLWDVTEGSLPQGLALSQDGVISGTPSGPDTKTFVVRVREPFRRFGERRLTLVVAAPLQATTALVRGEVKVRFRGVAAATGGIAPLEWAVTGGSLPRGLVLDPATGTIAGTPRQAGSFPVTFTVTDGSGSSAAASATLRISPRLLVVAKRPARAKAGRPYRMRLTTTGGLAPIRWKIVRGKLPPGIRLNVSTGRLAGTTRKPGRYKLIVQASDRLGGVSRRFFVLRVVR